MAVSRSALLVGATGLVGSHLLSACSRSQTIDRVTVWVRREVPLQDPKLTQVRRGFRAAATVFLGAGRGGCVRCARHYHQAGGFAAGLLPRGSRLPRPDRVPGEAGAGRSGSSWFPHWARTRNSRVFYSRVKGEAENAIRELGLPKLWFFRPSLLLGARVESRPGEKRGRGGRQTDRAVAGGRTAQVPSDRGRRGGCGDGVCRHARRCAWL